MFSRPWMHMFYKDLMKSQNPINTMQIVKGVIKNLNKFEDPKTVVLAGQNFFGNMLPQEEKEKLMVAASNESLL